MQALLDLWYAQVSFAKDFSEVTPGAFMIVTADKWMHTHEAKPNEVPVWPNVPLTSWIQLRDFKPPRRHFLQQQLEDGEITTPTSATVHLTEEQLRKWTAYRGPVL